MLERASTCLESGGRQLVRAPKQCLRSRRMLHSSFWHHGAGDLSLPAMWAAPPERATGDGHRPDGLLLDFLYPEKTLALLQRWSNVEEARRKPWQAVGVRQYSTWKPGVDRSTVESLEEIQAREDAQQMLGEFGDNALQHLLRHKYLDRQELAWQLYQATPDAHRTPPLLLDLLGYLSLRTEAVHTSRTLQIFDALPAKDRPASAYRMAISAYITMKMIGPAVTLHEEAAHRFDTLEVGTDIILERVVQDEQWDLTFRVFKTFLRQADRLNITVANWDPDYNDHGDSLAVVWEGASKLPYLRDHWESFIAHVHEFRNELLSTKENEEVLQVFTTWLAPKLVMRLLTSNEDEDTIYERLRKLMDGLDSLGLTSSRIYEFMLLQMLEMPKHQEYTHELKPFILLYAQYRSWCNEEPWRNLRPSTKLMARLIRQYKRHRATQRIETVVKDWRDFYPTKNRLSEIVKPLVQYYAELGDVACVHQYFDELYSSRPHQVDLHVLSWLPYAYARRKDVAGAARQFRRISDEFGAIPDIACWNIMILAYTRIEDLDGALECFNNTLESGVQPDEYTFQPMLDLCASRGDIEAYEALFTKAKDLGIRIDKREIAQYGYVRAFVAAGDLEGATAVAKGMLRSWRDGTLDGTLTKTWNMLILEFGFRGDLHSAREAYKEMIENNITLDEWTFAALMRGLIEANQTNAAWKILRRVMLQYDVRPHAFHYVLVITGFLRERSFKEAEQAYERMIMRKIPQTPDSRRVSILIEGLRELRELKNSPERLDDPRQRLEQAEQRLRNSILADFGKELAHRQPRKETYVDADELSTVPQSYFSLIIMLYTARGSYKICQEMFEMANKHRAERGNYDAPLTLMISIMKAHYKAGEHAEVAKCYEYTRAQAERFTKTLNQIMNPPSPTQLHSSLVDPEVRQKHDSAPIARTRRHVLQPAARIYMRSLLAQQGPEPLRQAHQMVNDLFTNGFTLANHTWNEYIRGLAYRGHLIDAFTICETYLTPHFPGWRELKSYYRRWDLAYYQWMELRHWQIKRDSRLPHYKTYVVLAAAMAQVKRDEMTGIGYHPELGGWLREVLEKLAPNTVRAIETMPRTGDPLQQRYLLR